jgi:predicted methyltransferase/DNA-directed RNA polymerase subunit RPC12/RpoP
MDVDAVAAEVAAAVGLAEGPAGVADVLRVIARHEPVAAREISRRAELPVPIVAAICNELRKRGVVDRARPVRLTPEGRASLTGQAEPGTGLAEITGRCPCCGGLGVVVPDAVAELAGPLEAAELAEPAAKLDLDQTHCTADTKLRRVLAMHEAGALAGQRILLLGDDDLVSVALAAFAGHAGGAARPRGVTVLDCDPDLVGYLRDELRHPGFNAEVIEHDLRDPLPAALTGAFDVACTDPPYTVAGAELFLSRAVDALAPGAGGHVFFSFGPRRPAETVATQRLMTEMGLAIRSLTPGFNFYTGAGILAGTSHLYHLRTTQDSKPARTGRYDGPLYSAQTRAAATRPYRCVACGAVHEVGPGARWTRIAELKAAGCPACGGTVLRPQPLRAGQGQGPRDGVAGAAGQRGVPGGRPPGAAGQGQP